MQTFPERLAIVNDAIAAAASRSGRTTADITLIAVSKTQTPERVREMADAGQVLFGENRVQEALAKIPLLPASLRWHLIGHLQSNKVRKALPHFEMFHGVDGADLVRDMDRVAAELGLFPRVLLEVNVSGEASKFGFPPAKLREEIDGLLAMPRVQVEGLMTIAPLADEPEKARPHFAALREFRDELAQLCGVPLSTLSMGMSGDFGVAIEEGATHVRVGTALFGGRP